MSGLRNMLSALVTQTRHPQTTYNAHVVFAGDVPGMWNVVRYIQPVPEWSSLMEGEGEGEEEEGEEDTWPHQQGEALEATRSSEMFLGSIINYCKKVTP
jgi:hypothetical protein